MLRLHELLSSGIRPIYTGGQGGPGRWQAQKGRTTREGRRITQEATRRHREPGDRIRAGAFPAPAVQSRDLRRGSEQSGVCGNEGGSRPKGQWCEHQLTDCSSRRTLTARLVGALRDEQADLSSRIQPQKPA
jgi:hypothetical protein